MSCFELVGVQLAMNSTVMRRIVRLVAFLAVVAVPAAAQAGSLSFQPPTGYADMNDLDHNYIYAWRLTGILNAVNAVAPGQVITGARLFFKNIDNWDPDPNKLFAHLLDTSITKTASSPYYLASGTSNSGLVAHQLTRAGTLETEINDNFATTAIGGDYLPPASNLVLDGTRNTKLGQSGTGAQANSSWLVGNETTNPDMHSFTETKEDFEYVFTDAQVLKLKEYLATNGDIAIALDPDGHFENDYVKLYIDYGPPAPVTPEPATMTLFALGAAGLYARSRKKAPRKNEDTEKS